MEVKVCTEGEDSEGPIGLVTARVCEWRSPEVVEEETRDWTAPVQVLVCFNRSTGKRIRRREKMKQKKK